MNREFFAGITVGDFTHLGAAALIGVVLSLTVQLIARRLKGRLRRNRASLAAQMVGDLDGALGLWLVMTGIYVGLLRLPPLGDHLSFLRGSYTIVSTAVVVYAGIRVQGDALTWYAKRMGRRKAQAKVVNSLVPMAKRIAAIAILAVGVLIILEQLGVSIAPLVAGLGIGGLAVALALQGTLTNFFAGLTILTDGTMRVGDFVELENGLSGYVDQIGWRTTRIRLFANNMVMIPNAKLADNIATNYNYPADEMSAYVSLGVSYSSDLDHVERVTVEVAKKVMEETPGSVEGYEPSVWYTDFGDSNINFWVVLRAHRYVDSWLIKHNFIKAIFRRYREEGIEISFPARNVFWKNEAAEPQPVQPVQEAARNLAAERGRRTSR